GLVLIAGLALLVRRRRPGQPLRPLLAAVLVAGVFAAALNLLLAHLGDHVLIRLPDWLPGLGGRLTLEALGFGLNAGLALAAAVLAVAPFSLVLEPHEVVDALPRGLERTGAALGAALNLLPGLSRSYQAVAEAQALRGWRRRGPGSWAEVMVPVLLTAVEGSLQLAEAMEARAFGSGRRTHFGARPWPAADVGTVATAAAAAGLFLAGSLAGLLQPWYPYPSLELPALDPFGLAAGLLLLVPALWPSPA
ncbi:MAG TPA: energy-coupling factor transporter transmembrane component T, partial [Candidatus Acidoferrales bacterium]|nr:energy-coupling factor transporter transmembrane component T [Candidatus Acidoferrales bacterium]